MQSALPSNVFLETSMFACAACGMLNMRGDGMSVASTHKCQLQPLAAVACKRKRSACIAQVGSAHARQHAGYIQAGGSYRRTAKLLRVLQVIGVTANVLGDMASRPNWGLNELDFVFATLVVRVPLCLLPWWCVCLCVRYPGGAWAAALCASAGLRARGF